MTLFLIGGNMLRNIQVEKYVLIFFVVVSFFILFTGCQTKIVKEPKNAKNDEILINYFKKAIDAVESDDVSSFQELFSNEVKSELGKDLESEIQSVIKLYQGKIQKYDYGSAGVETHVDSDGNKSKLKGVFSVETDVEKYVIYISVNQDDSNANNNGMRRFELYEIPLDTYKNYLIESMPSAGAFAIDKTMSQMETSDYLYGIMNIIGSNNENGLIQLFTNDINSSDLKVQAEGLLKWFQGSMKNYSELRASVTTEGDCQITEAYYEVSTYDAFQEYGVSRNEILNTYLVYFKHQRELKNSSSDGMLTVQIVEKTSDDMELVPIDQHGIYFDFM